MVVHTCEKCYKNFNKKSAYISHINRKKSCNVELYENDKINEINKIDENTENIKICDIFKCDFCCKKFSSKYNLNRHVLKCKINITNHKIDELVKKFDKINVIDDLNKEDIKKEIHSLKIIQPTIINNNYIIQNIQQNIQTNIQYNDFGHEDLTKINLKDILERKADVIPKFLYELHCSINRPENFNIGIKDKKRYQAFIREKGLWNQTNKNNALNNVLNKIISFIADKHAKDCEILGLHESEKLYLNALKEIKNIDPNEHRYEKQKHKETLKTIENVLYDNKERIFSDKAPVIKKRTELKSIKREEFKNNL